MRSNLCCLCVHIVVVRASLGMWEWCVGHVGNLVVCVASVYDGVVHVY